MKLLKDLDDRHILPAQNAVIKEVLEMQNYLTADDKVYLHELFLYQLTSALEPEGNESKKYEDDMAFEDFIEEVDLEYQESSRMDSTKASYLDMDSLEKDDNDERADTDFHILEDDKEDEPWASQGSTSDRDIQPYLKESNTTDVDSKKPPSTISDMEVDISLRDQLKSHHKFSDEKIREEEELLALHHKVIQQFETNGQSPATDHNTTTELTVIPQGQKDQNLQVLDSLNDQPG